MVQFGSYARLARERSRVQIPLGPLPFRFRTYIVGTSYTSKYGGKKYSHLLEDADVRLWYENVAGGCKQITEQLRASELNK